MDGLVKLNTMKDKSKLVRKVITNSKGHKQTVWVRQDGLLTTGMYPKDSLNESDAQKQADGSVDKTKQPQDLNAKLDGFKRGDKISITYGSGIRADHPPKNLEVVSRNVVGKNKVDKITFKNTDNPKGVRFYAYNRGNGRWGFAMGDMAISNIKEV